ncbi:MAG: hypothetical protein WD069_16840 [Planctomycetales bacterium]
MTAAWMLSLALCAPPAEAIELRQPVAEADDDVEADYRSLVQRTHRLQRPDPHEFVPRLVELRGRVAIDSALHAIERRRMTRGLDVRLVEMHTRLRHEVSRAERDAKRAARTPSAEGGAALPRAALDLIGLIETTVAPETWAINGGRGTITYWGPGMALVIRQTGEAHHQVGGTLQQMRRADQ